MFDLSFSEIAIIAVIAVVVIGPKELPRALSTAGRWVAKGRAMMGQLRTGFDAMVREAELQEMEKKWTAENERIMLEHPTVEVEGEVEGDSERSTPPPQMTPLPQSEPPALPAAAAAPPNPTDADRSS